MRKFDLGQTISIVANLGVIAGIVFLAIEIRQNQTSLDEQNRLNRQSSRDAALENFSTVRQLLLQDHKLLESFIKGSDDEELSGLERVKWSLLCAELIWAQGTTYQRYNSLGEYDSAASDVSQMRERISRSANWRDCWDNLKGQLRERGWYEFVNAVDE